MDNQDFNNMDNLNENYGATTTTAVDQSNGNNATKMKDRLASQAGDVKNKVKQQANQFGQQMNEKIDRSRGVAAERLRGTSQGINSLAMYLENNDSTTMRDDLMRKSEDTIRHYPVQSLLTGVLFGVFIGRLFR